MKLLNIFITIHGNINATIYSNSYGNPRVADHSVVTKTCEPANLDFLAECDNVKNLDFSEYDYLSLEFDGKKHNFVRIDPGVGFIDMMNYNATKDICNELN